MPYVCADTPVVSSIELGHMYSILVNKNYDAIAATFVEDNPITLAKDVSIQGTELRNCIVTPQNPDKDVFYVNNGCHMTNLSFSGAPATNNSSVISLFPLSGVSSDRFFDAARMIRMNLDFIASEAVGYLTSTNYKNPTFVIPTGNPNDCKDDINNLLTSFFSS